MNPSSPEGFPEEGGADERLRPRFNNGRMSQAVWLKFLVEVFHVCSSSSSQLQIKLEIHR